MDRGRLGIWATWAVWVLLAVPGLFQLGLLLATVVQRLLYPYDLEWMEGGLLVHAARIAEGESIYPEPSVRFIPYLYTPLYPALLAFLGRFFGISYQLGRAVSVAAIVAVVALMAVAIHQRPAGAASRDSTDDRARWLAAWCGSALAAGFFAAGYPWLEGWYDLVRADTLFLAMILAGLVRLRSRARIDGWRGQLGVAGAAALLGLSFFCKQTGIFYVAVGGALLLVWNWRRVPVYVFTAGVIGLGGTGMLDRMTVGWFWTYVFEVHQAHDFNMDRFYKSFHHILWKFPVLSVVVAATLVMVLVTWAVRKARPAGAGGFLTWSFVFAMSCVVGAVGWGTQWAHFNAYMPALMTGALAVGAAIPAIHGCVAAWTRDRLGWLATAMAAAAALACGLQLYAARWQPTPFIPTARDATAGDALIAHIRELREQTGRDVYVPYHPWYARLAGQETTYTHRMGLMDLSYQNRWQIAGLREAFRQQRFAAVILDNRPPGWELPELTKHYRKERALPAHMKPRVYTGAKVVPDTVWVPRPRNEPPAKPETDPAKKPGAKADAKAAAKPESRPRTRPAAKAPAKPRTQPAPQP